MATTARKLIKKAMQKCGILTKTQDPSADEANDGLDALNAMLSSWSNDSTFVYARSWETFLLSAGVSDYLIGPNQVPPNFSTVRPIDVIVAAVSNNGTDTTVAVVTDEIFLTQIARKDAPGLPNILNFNNAFPVATVRLFPVPNAAYTLKMLTEKILSQFTLDNAVDLPPGWERALIFNLAIEIAGDYDQQVPDAVVKVATSSRGLIKKAVIKNHNMDAFPQQGNAGNIFQGYWNG